MKSPSSNTSRRRFLQTTAAAVGFPTVVPSSVFGQNAPSKRITMGVVGWGMQAPGNTSQFLNMPDVQVVASANVDKKHLEASLNAINGKYGNKDAKGYHDYREMMARKDIDTVMLAVPDNWHALMSVEAANNKKDIYGEKPLARTVREQQAIVKAVESNQRIWQTGSWQRSTSQFLKAAELVRNGAIGKVVSVEVGLPSGHHDFAGTGKFMEKSDPPPELDYDMWIGPARMEPYIKGRIHMNWRWNYNVGGGQLLDWIGHHCDIAHWGMDMDNGGPEEVKPIQVDFPPKDAVYNTATKYRAELTYPGGVKMTIAGGHDDIRGGTKWIGTDGWIWVDRGGFDSSNPEHKKYSRLPEAQRKVSLYYSGDHFKNFIACVKDRKPTITPVRTAHCSAVPGHLSLISFLTNRTLKWDAKKEEIIGDAEAAKLLGREYRGPWKLA
ncbi:MAG: Gfo/Idh/MocA family oxidoreductase [Verrucomicrobiales bacterium]|nr:Gfo/Idh/MocA family oxidoreductase [Verrucomicrobiales bacterium]